MADALFDIVTMRWRANKRPPKVYLCGVDIKTMLAATDKLEREGKRYRVIVRTFGFDAPPGYGERV